MWGRRATPRPPEALAGEYELTPGQITVAQALHLLLDADLSSHGLVRLLSDRGHDVVAAGLEPDLKQLDDPILFAVAQEHGRVLITHNSHDVPDILRDWAETGRSHRGCIIGCLPTHAYGEMGRRLDRWFQLHPFQDDWIDRAVIL